MLRKLSKSKSGFTLVESLVAITVFLVVVTMVGSIYISFVHQERRLYEFLKTENNIRFALDYMGRDIRMAKSYPLFKNTFNNSTSFEREGISFFDYQGLQIEYVLASNPEGNKSLKVTRNGEELWLLDKMVNIDYLQFYITDSVKGVNQPTVLITLKATDRYGNKYDLETAVTPRNLNLLGS